MSFWSSIFGDGDTPPRVFWEKRLQGIENKGKRNEKERQENSRGGKALQGKEIEEGEEVKGCARGVLLWEGAGETEVRRVFTGHDRADYLSCQYIKWVLVFRDWAQYSAYGGRSLAPAIMKLFSKAQLFDLRERLWYGNIEARSLSRGGGDRD